MDIPAFPLVKFCNILQAGGKYFILVGRFKTDFKKRHKNCPDKLYLFVFKIGILLSSMYCKNFRRFLWDKFKSITNKAKKTVWNAFLLAFMIPTEMKETNISSLLITFSKFEMTWCCVTLDFYTLLFQLSPGQVVTRRAAAWLKKQRNGNAVTKPRDHCLPFDLATDGNVSYTQRWYYFSPFFGGKIG